MALDSSDQLDDADQAQPVTDAPMTEKATAEGFVTQVHASDAASTPSNESPNE